MSTRALPSVVIAFPGADRDARWPRAASLVRTVASPEAEGAAARRQARRSSPFFALQEALQVDARNQMYS